MTESGEQMTKYECPVCKKVEWSNGYHNQTNLGVHPRTCKHGDYLILMRRK
ncbi:hypothetical protein bcere0004_53150 [Bacillus cereus BGSC 6E1]|nr:hypothetical protein bcere0004_55860 [Bacillus cereus BGSC 6E1]EEK53378.1 hypothetical protein bcere0004_53150 [Bacillus cereus BGSC 6E1]